MELYVALNTLSSLDALPMLIIIVELVTSLMKEQIGVFSRVTHKGKRLVAI